MNERYNPTSEQLAAARARIAEVKAKREDLAVELQQCENMLKKLEARQRYRRSVKDRRRTHRLIQYGAAAESRYHELSALSDPEIYTLMENLLELPGAAECVGAAVTAHEGCDI